MLMAIFVYSGALAFGNFVIIKPQIRKYETLKKQRESLDDIYLRVRSIDVEQVLKYLQAELEESQKLKTAFESRTIRKEDFSTVLGELNRIVQKTGVKLQSIDPSNESDGILGSFQKKPVRISFQGSYPQFLTFLGELEQSRFWLLIDSYSVMDDPKDRKNHIFKIVVYSIVS